MGIDGKTLCFIITLLILSCSGKLEAETASVPQEEWPSYVRFGIIPIAGQQETEKKFRLLGEELGKILGIKVQIISTPNYKDIITGMKKKQFEFAYHGPYSYVLAKELGGIEAVATELDQSGKPGYHAILVTRADSTIHSIEEAKALTIAFTEPKSTSGFLLPMLYLTREKHIIPSTYFSSVVMAGDHAKVLQGVASGDYQIGASSDIDLDKISDGVKISPQIYRVLWKSDLIPGSPYCVRQDLPDSLKAAFREALLEMNDNPPVLEELGITGFVLVSDKDYDIIRRLKDIN